MASLHAPLPTLRPAPHGTRRTARGRRDSLGLHRSGLAPPTPCRSPDALPGDETVDLWLAPSCHGRAWPGHDTRTVRWVNHFVTWYDFTYVATWAGFVYVAFAID